MEDALVGKVIAFPQLILGDPRRAFGEILDDLLELNRTIVELANQQIALTKTVERYQELLHQEDKEPAK